MVAWMNTFGWGGVTGTTPGVMDDGDTPATEQSAA
jgi:hypothetical protein